MAAILVATAGGATANSYCTKDEADTYHDTRLHNDVWDEAGTSEKEAALIWATRLLDENVNWSGLKATDTQALRWPRTYVYDLDGSQVTATAIPQFLKNATAELARQLLEEDRTTETNRDLVGFRQVEVGPLNLVVDTFKNKATIPPSVWSMITAYGSKIGRSKTLVRM